MLPKLILRESSLQKDQKTYLNHSHISNIRGVRLKTFGTLAAAKGPTPYDF